jgi:hypothetical protein
MRLKTAHVQNYRSIKDTGEFEIEFAKTIFVGPNEAGKTAVLQALQKINSPKGVKGFDALRDYPRASYNDITTKKVELSNIPVVTATFSLEPDDQEAIPAPYRECTYTFTRYLDNSGKHYLNNGPARATYGSIKKDLFRLAAHVDGRTPVAENSPASTAQVDQLSAATKDWDDNHYVNETMSALLKKWLQSIIGLIDESNKTENARHDSLNASLQAVHDREIALSTLHARKPVFVLFSNYFRVRPINSPRTFSRSP